MIRVRVARPPVTYAIRVESKLLDRAGALIHSVHRGGTAALVTDRVVRRLYADRVQESLEASGYRVHRAVVPAGERAKSMAQVTGLAERWAREGIARDAVVVALGGGVVSDLAGFAAATYARGIAWIAFPTTLVAQADAAIGGKVGVNLDQGKNLVGAYHHPLAVFADTDTLRTLSRRDYRAGLAEVLKVGVVGRAEIVAILDRLARNGRVLDPRAIEPALRLAASEKGRVVSRDEKDQGARLALNFGHTVGHALEAASGYRRYRHGEAVAIGMVAALRLSVLEVGLDPVAAAAIEALLRRLGLPTRLDREPGARFWSALGRDKKRGPVALRMVLCPSIGEAKVHDLPSLSTLRRVVRSLVRLS